MKKISWLFSINADGVSPLGYGGIKTQDLVLGHAVNFQEEVKKALAPDINIEFVSYNMNSSDIPCCDLVIYYDVDALYLDEKIKKDALCLPFKLYVMNDIEAVKTTISARI